MHEKWQAQFELLKCDQFASDMEATVNKIKGKARRDGAKNQYNLDCGAVNRLNNALELLQTYLSLLVGNIPGVKQVCYLF